MLYADPLITAYSLIVTGLLGLVMGSFINCWAWRSTHGESVLAGRSHCTACGHELGVRDLVPVFSWLLSGRRCRYCGDPVSARYPATELLCAAVYVAIVAVFGLTLEALELVAFASVLLFLSLTDLDCRRIPDACILAAIAIRVAYLVVQAVVLGADVGPEVVSSLVGAVALGGGILLIVLVADRVLGRESMGWGDVKLFAVAGLYFGWQQGLFLVAVSCFVGLLFSAISLSTPEKDPQAGSADAGKPAEGDAGQGRPAAPAKAPARLIPFGPSIALACIITMFAGQPFLNWYLSFFM